METRHINYKSDFVIRERFRDGTGKVVSLPDVDFELRYWVGSHSVKATRKDGVYTGCVPDGDGLLVIFKDHGLGEGELHHELHLALDNALFENGVQNVYYPESLHIWLWDKMGDTEGVVESDCVAAYTRGYKFTWEDFTAADIIVLQKPATEAAERADNNVREFIEAAQRKNEAAVNNAKAATAAADCDVIIAVLGEDESCTGESKSRTGLDLPGRQQQLLEALHATGKPVVLVLINGQPLTINWADRNIPSILEAWFPGQLGGEAIAQTLFGDYNPGGRLSVTFPRSIGQIEFNFPFKPGSQDGQYFEGPNGSGRTRVNGALYPFGYGLSYTTFAYSNLSVKQETPYSQSPVTVTVDVTNTGKRAGDEVVQLYIRDKVSSVIAYESVLRGFERISLQPGETKTVSFVLLPEDLQILDRHMEWTVEPGEFEVRIGASSNDIKLKETFVVK
nr:MAG TPA: beta-D-glucoside glucohydrolase [Caudoviricetes sp.]